MTPLPTHATSLGDVAPPTYWISDLAATETESTRNDLLASHRAEFSPALVDVLYDKLIVLARVDLRQAERIALAAQHVATTLPHGHVTGVAHRAQGHVCFLTGDHVGAIEHHRRATEIFESFGDSIQAARARMNQIQPLTYLGRYDEAFTAANLARSVFLAHGDRLRVARLDVNLANAFYRQDRFQDALDLYKSAQPEIESSGDAQDIAVLLRNMAVCYASLTDFDQAAKTYQQARDLCDASGFPLLVAEADYNVAYLHYLRGEYTRAIALYQTARQLCARLKNHYHMALCDLDLSELYLELNMSQEGATLAEAAYQSFESLGMHYEKAKALAFSAIAASQLGQNREALARFAKARALFVVESNRVWPGLIDFYRALVLFEDRRFAFATRLAKASLQHFLETGLQTKAALAQILLARLGLESKHPLDALDRCNQALAHLQHAASPAIEFHAVAVLSSAQEALGQLDEAYASLKRADRILEDLRSHILGEAFRIGFLKDKLSIYQRLTYFALQLEPARSRDSIVFNYIERAKSRSLADLVSLGAHVMRSHGSEALPDDVHVEKLRQRMTMAYRQAQREDFRADRDSVGRIVNYREESREYEQQLALASGMGSATGEDLTSLLSAGTLSVAEVHQHLPPQSAIVEYFEISGLLQAAVLHAGQVLVVALCPLAAVRTALSLLQFQLSKYHLGPEHIDRFQHSIQAATDEHLARLFEALIAPLELPGNLEHLIVVPHGCLHALPFHALIDRSSGTGAVALMEKFTVTYAPSASVFTWCRKSLPNYSERSLVLGIPDSAAPSIREEAIAVASMLPNSRLFLGSTATREILWQIGPESRIVHIATHGLFRKDNPMFSSIRLGDADLHPADFYSLRLSARLVTLSGCGTGLNAIVGGDEILGLVRGLLYAGAQAVLVSLWDVSDSVTSLFMKVFYRELRTAPSLSEALRITMRSIRETHPQPYYWAPFILIGDGAGPAFPPT
jgi:CHAT domain-containing protein